MPLRIATGMKLILVMILLAWLFATGLAASASTGAIEWVQRYDGAASTDNATAIGASPDGSTVFVTGYSVGTTSKDDYVTIAYDAATGAQLWVARYDDPASGVDHAAALAVSPDGTAVFVTGRSHGAGTGNDYATIAYDAVTGAQLWVARYNGVGSVDDNAYAVATSPDGTAVYVTGSTGTNTAADYATVAYDAGNGTERWVRTYAGPGNGQDIGRSLAISPDGATVAVTGQSYGTTTGDDYATIAYDAGAGTPRWIARYNGAADGFDDAFALAVAPDGSALFVTGSSWGGSTSWDYATVAYDAVTARQLWVRRYDNASHGSDFARAVVVSPDSSTIYVSGYGTDLGTGAAGYETLAYAVSGGTRLWAHRYAGNGHQDSFENGLAVSADGSEVFVTGQSKGTTTYWDYATIAYATSGAPLWTRRYDGPGRYDDFGNAVATNPVASQVFVTGAGSGLGTHLDYATIAYAS
jgi:WD40 repeat protein